MLTHFTDGEPETKRCSVICAKSPMPGGNARLEMRSDSQVSSLPSSGWEVADSIPHPPTTSQTRTLQAPPPPRLASPAPGAPGAAGRAPQQLGRVAWVGRGGLGEAGPGGGVAGSLKVARVAGRAVEAASRGDLLALELITSLSPCPWRLRRAGAREPCGPQHTCR